MGICLLSCLLVAFGISCSKNNSNSGTTKTTLSLSNSSVKKGQPLVVTANVSQSSAFVEVVSKSSFCQYLDIFIGLTNLRMLFSSFGKFNYSLPIIILIRWHLRLTTAVHRLCHRYR